MRVNDIKESIQLLKYKLSNTEYESPLYLFELPQKLDSNDYLNWINNALQSDFSHRLWKRRTYRPLEHLNKIAKGAEEYLSHACFDLFNEENTLDGRVNRFIFYMDELLKLYRNSHSTADFSDHHIDQAFVSLLLAKAYPEKYGIYQFLLFQKTAERIGAQPLPIADDLARFERFVKVYKGFIEKDKDLVKLHQERCLKTNLSYALIPANIAVECMAVREEIDLLSD